MKNAQLEQAVEPVEQAVEQVGQVEEQVGQVEEAFAMIVPSSPNTIRMERQSPTRVSNRELINIREEDFDGCRITQDGKISIIDSIRRFFNCDRRTAAQKLTRHMKSTNCSSQHEMHKFPGNSNPTPVAKFEDIIGIMSKLPGAFGNELRSRQSLLMTRSIAGNRDLAEAINDRADTIRQFDQVDQVEQVELYESDEHVADVEPNGMADVDGRHSSFRINNRDLIDIRESQNAIIKS